LVPALTPVTIAATFVTGAGLRVDGGRLATL